jgi:hypothetical protein
MAVFSTILEKAGKENRKRNMINDYDLIRTFV